MFFFYQFTSDSATETECASKLRLLVQRILATFSPGCSIPKPELSADGTVSPKQTVTADIRLLDVIAQAERITSLKSSASLLPLFDFALLSVKRLYANSFLGTSKKTHTHSQQQQQISEAKISEVSIHSLSLLIF